MSTNPSLQTIRIREHLTLQTIRIREHPTLQTIRIKGNPTLLATRITDLDHPTDPIRSNPTPASKDCIHTIPTDTIKHLKNVELYFQTKINSIFSFHGANRPRVTGRSWDNLNPTTITSKFNSAPRYDRFDDQERTDRFNHPERSDRFDSSQKSDRFDPQEGSEPSFGIPR